MSDPPSTSASASHAPPAPRPAKEADESIKETLESIVIAFVLAFVFRAYVVEAFVIPTGSMAPTLLGEHVRVTCRQCGYRFAADPRAVAPPFLAQDAQAVCPMCHFPNAIRRGTRLSAGDRILVHKYLYSVSEPRRWDVVVFKNPTLPAENYIKRLVGLPGEEIILIDGNVWARPADGGQDAWGIARKSDREQVQRAVWQPVYHSPYLPLDGGDPGQLHRSRHPWRVPWVASQPADGSGWDIEGRRSYRFDSAASGQIRFDFGRAAHEQVGWYPYNQLKGFDSRIEHIEDVRLAAAFQPDEPGLAVTLQTTSRLDDPAIDPEPQVLVGRIDSTGRATLEVRAADGGTRTLGEPTAVRPLPAGVATRVELWYVDLEASLWVNGRRVLTHRFDGLSVAAAMAREPPRSPYPQVALGVEGSPVTLHRVEVDRDLYYSPRQYGSPPEGVAHLLPLGGREARWGAPGAASYFKERGGLRAGGPLQLEADQFFCLGDNSPASHDGRAWNTLDPWIEERLLSDNQHRLGVVPRRLMMGRAFFVYFPAAYPARENRMGVIPNFAEMRFIH